ncbi:hypothetical protein EVAR_3148_1 [Eumeta japonica]|uniref:Uncharacterized protein n=1 Tax=Eumeta variegata TaxID=151549 RepID=A0A4C1XEY1_EUMVA|nr:hypothetical protein EVAR_3148_1 [Eumeta japonica]
MYGPRASDSSSGSILTVGQSGGPAQRQQEEQEREREREEPYSCDTAPNETTATATATAIRRFGGLLRLRRYAAMLWPFAFAAPQRGGGLFFAAAEAALRPRNGRRRPSSLWGRRFRFRRRRTGRGGRLSSCLPAAAIGRAIAAAGLCRRRRLSTKRRANLEPARFARSRLATPPLHRRRRRRRTFSNRKMT